ncbi:MAG: hypothetical protein ABI672_14765 [Vicinamibacteria bacterium]
MNLSPNRQHFQRLAFLALLITVHVGCGTPSDLDGTALFRVRACKGSGSGEIFHIQLSDPRTIAEADALVGVGQRKIPVGRLVAGSGGFNAPWSWHMDPSTVTLADAAIEVCDGCPSFVENELPYWLNTVKTYCPWSAEILAREK